jgi:HTH-type transcriptional regulator/antitoxin HigA
VSKTLADPVAMMRGGAPRLIRSANELVEYTRALLSLTAKPQPGAAEQDAINLLTLLIEQYETVRYAVPKGSPIEVLRQLLDRDGVNQNSLGPDVGGATDASLLMQGKRQFTRSHIARLSKRFKVSPNVFFDEISAVPLRRDMGKRAARSKSRQTASPRRKEILP